MAYILFQGVLDEGYSYDLSVEDAKELGMKSIYHATYRDAASGGYVNRKFHYDTPGVYHGHSSFGSML